MTTKIPVELSSTPSIVDNGDATAITIDSSENVGIGVTTPFSQTQITETGWSSGAPYGTVLTVTGNNTNDANWGHLLITDSSTGTGNGGMLRFAVGSTSSDISPHSGIDGFTEGSNYGGLKFLTRPNGGTSTERMRIDSSGRLLIGQTSAARTNEVLQVSGAEGINAKATANGGVAFAGLESSGNTAGATFLSLASNLSTVVFKVAVGGGIHSTSTSITSLSDERAKENIRDLEIGLNEIKQLKPRRFDWKEGKGSQTKNTMGFIAQEVEKVNGFETLIAEWDDSDIENAKALKMGDMLPVLTKAIQEQQAIIEDLQTQINEVKNGNNKRNSSR